MSSTIRVLVDIRKIEGKNGTDQVIFTHKCAKPIRRPVPDIVTYFETEKTAYHSCDEGEEIVQEHMKYRHSPDSRDRGHSALLSA